MKVGKALLLVILILISCITFGVVLGAWIFPSRDGHGLGVLGSILAGAMAGVIAGTIFSGFALISKWHETHFKKMLLYLSLGLSLELFSFYVLYSKYGW